MRLSPGSVSRSQTITTQLDLTGNEEGVIVACGGFMLGYMLFITDNRLYCDYKSHNDVFSTLESTALAERSAARTEIVLASNPVPS